MSTTRISLLSKRMSTFTLAFLTMMILLNVVAWLFPSNIAGHGLGFSLTESFISDSKVNVASLPGWQIAGAILLSSIPLLALVFGLYQLRLLFQTYAQKAYFSVTAAQQLGRVGKSIAIWTLLTFLCEPLLSIWLTMQAPEGQQFISFSFTVQDIVALFLAVCITIIAHILQQASLIYTENQEFI